MVRHCSMCRSTAHDRRNCPRLARNPEFATGAHGVYPIRKGKGVHVNNGQPYDPNKAKGDKAAALRARQVAKGSPATRKHARLAEAERKRRENAEIEERLSRARAEDRSPANKVAMDELTPSEQRWIRESLDRAKGQVKAGKPASIVATTAERLQSAIDRGQGLQVSRKAAQKMVDELNRYHRSLYGMR